MTTPVTPPSHLFWQRLGRALAWVRRRWRALAIGAGALTALTALVAVELSTSRVQSRLLADWASELDYTLAPGGSPGNHYPQAGPYDERMGYTRIPDFVTRLGPRGFEVSAQAHQSPQLVRFGERGFFPAYREKPQGGLRVQDCRNAPLYDASFPQQVFASYDEVPPLLAQTLAYIENREVLDSHEPRKNPAVEWQRLGRAVLDQFIEVVNDHHSGSGGSTLATQLEKFRHSPEGRTDSMGEKYRQMVSASVRAYLEGEETAPARRRIVLDYLNGLPLGAQHGYGEVIGILDGLRVWYGADPQAAREILRASPADPAGLAQQARAYRQALNLLIAQRRPTHYLGAGQEQLAAQADAYLRLLAQDGIISPALRDAALQARPEIKARTAASAAAAEVPDRKAAYLTRVQLASLLGTARLYDVDRFDLVATSTIDGALQKAVTDTLRGLREPSNARAAGLVAKQLLAQGDPAKLAYSFTLYERGPDANRVRVQTDNLEQPFDINSGAKLELGSTAKLRTLASYLEIVASLHGELVSLSPKALAAREVPAQDAITRWAVDYLATAQDRSLAAMLEAAMARRYSASPWETFFTGGGQHSFANFNKDDNERRPTVAESLRDSINLPFIRLMRDVVRYHLYRGPYDVDKVLADPEHPGRAALLARFADAEGRRFTRRFYQQYRGQTPEQSLARLTERVPANDSRASAVRLAVIYRSWAPEASFEDFSAFFARSRPTARWSEEELRALYARYAMEKYSLADRGYLARVHPLELWVAAYLHQQPAAPLSQVQEAGRELRQEVYGWLLRSRHHEAQNIRIRILLEEEAFIPIHRAWQRLGYPFDSLVPSYATAIGSSGDRPAALAELVGILLNNGERLPSVHVDSLHLAAGTPYETLLSWQPQPAQRVMVPEVAAALRQAMALVVEHGTARRVQGAFDTPGQPPVRVGGKTGTGDNRIQSFSARGALRSSQALNRTATFVFFIGDRHFGTLTAFVEGEQAEAFQFTSALPTQILKIMAPLIAPALRASGAGVCVASGELSPMIDVVSRAPVAGEDPGLAVAPSVAGERTGLSAAPQALGEVR